MSIKVSAICWKVPLPATEKLVLLRLADFANDAGFNIWPAVQTVANDCGVGIRAVQLTLKKLVKVGILVVMNQGGGRGRATEYAIDLDLLSALRAAPPAAAQYANGHAGKGANSESSAGFSGENPEPSSPFMDGEKGEKGASDDINPEPRSPHPLLSVEEGSEAYASGAAAPDGGGNVVQMPLSAEGELFGPVLQDLAAAVPDVSSRQIRSMLGKAKGHLGPDAALAMAKQALRRAEPWSWLCKSINERMRPAAAAGGRPLEAGAAEFLDLYRRKMGELS